VRCNEIQGAQGVENAEATSLASGRNADGSDARYFFADGVDIRHRGSAIRRPSVTEGRDRGNR